MRYKSKKRYKLMFLKIHLQLAAYTLAQGKREAACTEENKEELNRLYLLGIIGGTFPY